MSKSNISSISPRERLICALDVNSLAEAKNIVIEVGELVSFYKIGLRLYLIGGLELIDWLVSRDKKVFLDLKFYDVPETVGGAVKQAAKLNVSLLTVHGNQEIIKRAVYDRGDSPLKLLAVTVLTSLDNQDLKSLGMNCDLSDLVKLRAQKAYEYGCDGAVSSPWEAGAVKAVTGDDFLVVCPGIRLTAGDRQDHKRFATPRRALDDGADYLVVGRPITAAADRRRAAQAFIDNMKSAAE